jgi:hypothetical protein
VGNHAYHHGGGGVLVGVFYKTKKLLKIGGSNDYGSRARGEFEIAQIASRGGHFGT